MKTKTLTLVHRQRFAQAVVEGQMNQMVVRASRAKVGEGLRLICRAYHREFLTTCKAVERVSIDPVTGIRVAGEPVFPEGFAQACGYESWREMREDMQAPGRPWPFVGVVIRW